MTARPFFIVSSGRSGTAMVHKALSSCTNVEMHHEFCCTHVQRAAVQRYMGLTGGPEVFEMLREIYVPALRLSSKPVWGDSSNKLSWIIPELAAAFPDARFVHLIRDGRKVTSSYFHKLRDECYDDFATQALALYAANPRETPAPPPEKRYWWPQPPKTHQLYSCFPGFNQFQRIAYHWAEINRVVVDAFADLPRERTHTVRLEDLCMDPAAIDYLVQYLGLSAPEPLFHLFERPHNVNKPVDTPLTHEQARAFDALAYDVMHDFGYAGTEEYRVAY